MQILVVGYHAEIEYISDMCQHLRDEGHVVRFFPFAKLQQDRTVHNVLERLFWEMQQAEVVCWQCLYWLELQDLAYLIERGSSVHILIYYDDNTSVNRLGDTEKSKLRLLNAVLTSSYTNAGLLGDSGIYHPAVLSISPDGRSRQSTAEPDNVEWTFFCAERDPAQPYHNAIDPAAYHQLPTRNTGYSNLVYEEGAAFVNIYQSDIGGASPDMLRCMALGIPVVSPTTVSISVQFVAGVDYIAIEQMSMFRELAQKLDLNAIREKVCAARYTLPKTFPLRASVDTPRRGAWQGIQPHYFDAVAYKNTHRLSITKEDAWGHFCTHGYPVGLFICCGPRDFSMPLTGNVIGEDKFQLMVRARTMDPFSWLASVRDLGIDPHKVLEALEFHCGSKENNI